MIKRNAAVQMGCGISYGGKTYNRDFLFQVQLQLDLVLIAAAGLIETEPLIQAIGSLIIGCAGE